MVPRTSVRKPELKFLRCVKLFELVGLSGLEPPTSRLSGVRSNLLSYRPALGLRRVLRPFSSFSLSYSSFNVQCISFVHWKMNSVPSLYRPFRLSFLKTQVLLLCFFGYFLTYSTRWRIPDFTPWKHIFYACFASSTKMFPTYTRYIKTSFWVLP